MALGAGAVLLGSVYQLALKNLNRHVTRVFPFRKNYAAQHCRHIAENTVKTDNYSSLDEFARKALSAAVARKDKYVNWLKTTKLPIGETSYSAGLPTIAAVYETAEAFLMSKWTPVPGRTTHIGAFPSLATIMGATWVGASYSGLEKVIGRTLAVTVLAILNGLITGLRTAKL